MSLLTPPQKYKISNASQTDIEALAQVHLRCWQTAYRGMIDDTYLDSLNFDNFILRQTKMLEKEGDVHLCIKHSSKVIGFCYGGKLEFYSNQLLTEEQKAKRNEKGEISAMYIHPSYQGKGIGSLLFNSMREELQKYNLSPFLLWVLHDNHKAINFYEKMGGVRVEETAVKIGERYYFEFAYRFIK
jgi:ribosomal protein S18 acetylase RimI-like enzyme